MSGNYPFERLANPGLLRYFAAFASDGRGAPVILAGSRDGPLALRAEGQAEPQPFRSISVAK